jgi:hypothetical protein
MAPREATQSKNEFVSPSKHKKHPPTTSTNTRAAVFFRIGPLRFGYHGIFGILGSIAVSYALLKSYMGSSVPFWLAFSVVTSSVASSVGSYGLLPQVPTSSEIASWIFPPHKEAFKRTIAIVGYLNIRLVHQWQWVLGHESLLFPFLLFLYTNYHFFPRQADYFNGNTWVFVIPMFIGFNVDTLMQFPDMDKTFLANPNWNNVHNWNKDRVNETYLLLTLLCALQIAFMFTIAFRGRMSIKYCYWIAAIEVGLLCVRLFHA